MKELRGAQSSMKVIALLTTYNERRFVSACIEHLNAQGVEVYVTDHGSTDETLEIVESFLGRGVVAIDHMPRHGMVDYTSQYMRHEELAARLDADWFLQVDADERHEPADHRTTLAEVFAQADELGFNAVNFVEYTFVPTAESPDHDHAEFEQTMEWYYPYVRAYPHRLNAWKRQDEFVDLLSHDGHRVVFPGCRIFPRVLQMRHYQFLSRAHGLEKYMRQIHPERIARLTGKNWTIGFHPDRLVLPSERELRRRVPGEPLDRTEPEGEPLWVIQNWREDQAT
jgi:glycosyltransferase involved in cell wall biosynthesis